MTLLEKIKYHINEKKCTCWKGYKRVPGTKPCSNDSCVKEQRLAEMGGVKGPMKDEKGRPTRKALALRKWNC